MSILLLIVNKFPTSMAAIGKEYPKIINTSRTWRKGRQTFLQGFRQRESFYAGSYLFTLIRSQYSTKQNKAWHTSFGLNCISTGNENSNFHISPFPFAESLRHSCVLEEKCLFFFVDGRSNLGPLPIKLTVGIPPCDFLFVNVGTKHFYNECFIMKLFNSIIIKHMSCSIQY